MALNGGHRRDALLRLAETLDVHVTTVRLWETGKRKPPRTVEIAIKGLLKERSLSAKLKEIREAVEEIDG